MFAAVVPLFTAEMMAEEYKSAPPFKPVVILPLRSYTRMRKLTVPPLAVGKTRTVVESHVKGVVTATPV